MAPENEDLKDDKNKSGEGKGSSSNDNKDDKNTGKEELDSIKGINAKLQQDMDDLKAEILTPEYIEFLESKNKGGKSEKDDKNKDDNKGEKDPYAGLTPSQIAAKIRDEIKADLEEDTKASQTKAVENFAKKHEDFEDYRPLMWGLAQKKEYLHADLDELYNAAKNHTKKIADGLTTDKDKKKGAKSGGEKPGGSSSGSVKNDGKILSPDEAANEAWEEVIGSGSLPPAV